MMRNKIIIILFLLVLSRVNPDEKKVLGLEEYSMMYYDIAIEAQIKPDNFFISKNILQEIFKMLVQQYYNISYLENISIIEHKEYYIITGSKNDEETGYNNTIRSDNSAVTLIIRKRDGAIISLFIES